MVSKKINEVVKRKRNFTDRSVNRIRWLTCGRSWWSFSFSLVFNQFEFQLVWLCVCISLLSNKLTTNDLSLYHLVWESHWVTFLAHHRRPLECDSSAEDRSLISSKIYCIDTMRPRLNRWRFKSADKSNGCAVLCKGKLWQVIELLEKIKKKSLFIFLSRSICLTSHSCQTIRSRTRRRLKRRKKSAAAKWTDMSNCIRNLQLQWRLLFCWVQANNIFCSPSSAHISHRIKPPSREF